MMMGFGWIGIILLLMFWGVLVAVALWLIRTIFPDIVQGKDSVDRTNLSAREVLDHRYARGELTRERYLAMIEDIQAGQAE